MTKARLEAFSDGVMAIIITIMVLELKIPHDASLQSLMALSSVFVSYLMSFIYVAIYWGNHHHLLHTLHHVNAKIIWANMSLLFFLSIIPFTTGWMGENHFASIPVCAYAVNLLLCAMSFYFLQVSIVAQYKEETALSKALQKQMIKGYVSLATYLISIVCALFSPTISYILIIGTAVLWVVPDKNIERALKE